MRQVKDIPIGKIYKRDNIRNEKETELLDLERSIDEFGLIQPITVKPVNGKYEIITGHRRFEAAKLHGDIFITCIVTDEIDEKDRIFVQLIENTHRKNMSAQELVNTFERIKKDNPRMSNAKIADKLGRSAAWVNNQYVALKLAKKMDGIVDPEKDSCGKIIGYAQTHGIYGAQYESYDIKLNLNGNKITAMCKNKEITRKLMNILLKKYFPEDYEKEQGEIDDL